MGLLHDFLAHGLEPAAPQPAAVVVNSAAGDAAGAYQEDAHLSAALDEIIQDDGAATVSPHGPSGA